MTPPDILVLAALLLAATGSGWAADGGDPPPVATSRASGLMATNQAQAPPSARGTNRPPGRLATNALPPPPSHAAVPTALDQDGDEMPDDWERAHGLDPTRDDAMEDLDQDGVPNLYEFRRGTDPRDPKSRPAATVRVSLNPKPGEFSVLQEAIDSLTDDFQIIEVEPGHYFLRNLFPYESRRTLHTDRPVLIMSTEGATATVLDGEDGYPAFFTVAHNTAISGFRFFRFMAGLGSAVRVENARVLVRDCVILRKRPDSSSEICIEKDGRVRLESVTIGYFLRDVPKYNTSRSHGLIEMEKGTTLSASNCIFWDPHSPSIKGVGSAELDHCLVRGGWPGEGNLDVDPLMTPEGHLTLKSPARGAGVAVPHGKDADNETRPPGAVDIGADQYVDTDNKGVPDFWQQKWFGKPVAGSDDPDQDGVDNVIEYNLGMNPTDPDSDDDGADDGIELLLGLDPIDKDSDNDDLEDGAELYVWGSNPLNADTDGDGSADGLEVFSELHTDEETAAKYDLWQARKKRPKVDLEPGWGNKNKS